MITRFVLRVVPSEQLPFAKSGLADIAEDLVKRAEQERGIKMKARQEEIKVQMESNLRQEGWIKWIG